MTEAEPNPGAGSCSGRQSRAVTRAPAAPVLRIVPPPQPGTYQIAELRRDQCRFACTDFRAPPDAHRFCGEPVFWKGGKPTSWCREHLARVYETSERSPVAADGAAAPVPGASPPARPSSDSRSVVAEADR